MISLHLPKTAGTSFAGLLKQRHGGRYAEDYAMLPMQLPRGMREAQALVAALRNRGCLPPEVDVIHGHFLPVSYLHAGGARPLRFVTWLRDPLQRVISHYHFWRRDYDGSDPRQRLRNRMLRERWSLERFCLGPEMRNLYRQYLWGFAPWRFDFIGITERYPQDLERFFGETRAHSVPMLLANPERGEERYRMSASLQHRMQHRHAADLRLYDWAVAGCVHPFSWR